MDERDLELKLAEELIGGWEIISTGSGFLVVTDWKWPNKERIEIHRVRRVFRILPADIWRYAGY